MSTTKGMETTSAGQPHGLEPTKKEILAGSPSRSTGPRTERGKQRSRHNALKHGIFSEAAVLKSESHAEFQSLLKGLRECLQPQGTLEEVLVEKLATILWRH